MMWNALMIIVLVVAIGVALQIGSTVLERIILGSILCGLIVYAFYWLRDNGMIGP